MAKFATKKTTTYKELESLDYFIGGYEVTLRPDGAVQFGCTLVRPTVFKELLDVMKDKRARNAYKIEVNAGYNGLLAAFIFALEDNYDVTNNCTTDDTALRRIYVTYDTANDALTIDQRIPSEIAKAFDLGSEFTKALEFVLDIPNNFFEEDFDFGVKKTVGDYVLTFIDSSLLIEDEVVTTFDNPKLQKLIYDFKTREATLKRRKKN